MKKDSQNNLPGQQDSAKASDNEAEQTEQQSLFSSRSGIRDLLKKADSDPASIQDTPPEIAIEPGEAAIATLPDEAQAAGDEIEKPLPLETDRDTRKRKRPPRLVKSKSQLDRARQRQMNYLQKRRQRKKLRVFNHRIRMIFKLCFAVIWAVLLWELLHSSFWTYAPVSGSAGFKVQNQRLLQASQLEPLIKPWTGKPIFAVDTGLLASQIKRRFDIVDRVVVRRLMFPPRLSIQIQEKKPWAEIYTEFNPKSGQQKANSSSQAKPNKAQKPPYALAVPSGIISLAPYAYKPLSQSSSSVEKLIVLPRTPFKISYLNKVHEMAWQARQISGLHLVSMDIRNPKLVILNFQEMPVILGELNHEASSRLARLVPLLPSLAPYREDIESVDLRWEDQVTFHQKPNAKIQWPEPEKTQG